MTGFVAKVTALMGVVRTPEIHPTKDKLSENININFSQNDNTDAETEQAILLDIERMAYIPE